MALSGGSNRREEGGFNPLYAIVLGAGVVLLLAALGLNYWLNRGDSPEDDALPAGPLGLAPGDEALQVPAPDQPAGGLPNFFSRSPDEEKLPLFDIVRIAPGGDTVIAGQALPDANVVLELDGRDLSTVRADDRGEWVFVGKQTFQPGEHRLKLRMELPGGDEEIQSSEDILILVPDEPLVLQGGKSPSQPLIVLLPGDEDRGTRILQRQFSDQVPLGPYFTVDTADYMPGQRLVLQGTLRAEPAVLVAYIDDQYIGETAVQGEGARAVEWRLDSNRADFRPGGHQLRVDMVVEGSVVVRRILPFEIDFPQNFDVQNREILVQRGDSLWRIARTVLGTGARYVVIFETNRDQITNPDLIFPGQVFQIPGAELDKFRP